MNELVRIREDFKALIPPLSEDERDGLEQSILEHGCRDALLTWNGWVIDGHNRYEICEGNGIEYRTQEMEFNDESEVKIWMIRNQFGRRNLDAYTRAKLAIELKGLFAAKAKENMAMGGMSYSPKEGLSNLTTLPEKIDTREELAKVAGLSTGTIAMVERIERDATPEIKEALRTSAISINGAYKAVKQVEKNERREEKAERKRSDTIGKFELFHCKISEVNGIEPESLDFIITDPPYPKEFLSVYPELALFSLKYLKPGGSLIAMVGQSYLPEIINHLSVEGLSYNWCLSYLTPGGQATQLWDRKVNTFWKPLLWFVKGEKYNGDWIGDVSKSNVNDNDKEHHCWGQSESGMMDIVNRFTYPGNIVCDPFCGGGTTGVVCVSVGRDFIGIDCDLEAIEKTKSRLNECIS